MADVVPPSAADWSSAHLQGWHRVFKTDWRDLVAMGYVDGADGRMYTENVTGLEAADGQVSFYGETYLEPEAQGNIKTSNASFYAVSSSASDTHDVRCWMVDENGDETITSVTLTGTTPVLIGSFVHCNLATAENGQTQNLGDITVSTKAIAGVPLVITDDVQCHIGIARGHGNNPRQLCPNNQACIFTSIDLSSDRLDGIDVQMHIGRKFNGGGPHDTNAKQWFIYESTFTETFAMPVALTAGEYLSLHIERSAAGTGAVNAGVNMSMYVLTASTNDDGAGTLFA
jgi:hypothetical protein